MKTIITVILISIASIAISQNTVPEFIVDTNEMLSNSTLGGAYTTPTEQVKPLPNELIFIKEMSEGDFVLLEINKDDKKNYHLELIDSNGDIMITIADFNSSSFKIVKNNLQKGNYTVFLTDEESQKIDIGIISL